MHVLAGHMQTNLDSKSAFNALTALVVQMTVVYVPFVLITSSLMIYMQLANQSSRIHQSIVQLAPQMHFVKRTQHSMTLVFQRTIGGTQEAPQGCIIVNEVARV
jgi:hypothetical protein